ncbi:ROK family protein [Actinocatenispora rupis]|uniref:Sugar kinase n=1 Tax=Actinocatenispora rupis TaxID=519421 RepID=A0A8J3NAD6_9ACTN|nr:ROK family protein [Actinocatenispora rupis]GID12259.1 sugar kinase [Actinocatenispora rupis]
MLDTQPPTDTVLGVDIGGTKVRAALATPDGRVLAEDTVASDRAGVGLIDQVGRIADTLVGRAGATPRHAVLGVPGTPDAASGRVLRCPAFPGLAELDARGAFTSRLGCPVTLDNDVNLAAYAEATRGGHAARTLAVLALGTGVGLGITSGGAVLAGDHLAAGEVAELPLPDAGALESVVSVAGLRAGYDAAGGRRDADVPEIVAAARRAEPAALRALDRYCRAVAYCLGAVITIVDPGAIVLTGGIGAAEPIAATVVDRLRELGGWTVPVVVSAFGERAPLVGALHAAASTADGVRTGR